MSISQTHLDPPGLLFRGRASEIVALESLLDAGSTHRVAWVHGLPGIGKTALVDEVARRATQGGWRVVRPGTLEVGEGPVLLVVDRSRPVGPAGARLREEVERLPAGSRVFVTAHCTPDRAWYDGGWDMRLLVVRLGRMASAESDALAGARGVPAGPARARLVDWAAGLPLALVVGAAELRRPDHEDRADSWEGDADGALLPVLLEAAEPTDGGWDTPRRTALEVAAFAGEVDRQLLRALMSEDEAAAAYAWLRELPWTSDTGGGLRLERQVRRLVADELARRAPARAGELRARLVSELLGRAVEGEPRLVAEVREVLAMPGNLDGLDTSTVDLWVDDLRDADVRAIPDLLAHRGADYTAWVVEWCTRSPEHALVVRDGASPGFFSLWATADRHPDWAVDDPVLGPWLDDARRQGTADDAVFQLTTDLVGEDAHFAQIVALAAGDILRRAGRTRARWWYHAIHADDEQAATWTTHLGSRPRSGMTIGAGSAGLATYVLDLGQGERPRLPARVKVDVATVRAALRDIQQPVLLAAHPLAHGTTVAARAASVRAVLDAAVESAFGQSASEELYRQVLRRGYLDTDAGAHVAQRELHLGRSTFFRRVAEASDRLATFFDEG